MKNQDIYRMRKYKNLKQVLLQNQKRVAIMKNQDVYRKWKSLIHVYLQKQRREISMNVSLRLEFLHWKQKGFITPEKLL